MTLPVSELVRIAAEVELLKKMGLARSRTMTIDYVPAREAIIIPRAPGEEDPITVYPPEVTELTFTLEDQMFGGVVYVALTCGGHIVIHPFVWDSYEKLSTTAITLRTKAA